MKTQFLLATAIFISFASVATPAPETKGRIDLSSSISKPNPIFDFVRGHRQGKGITMNWGSSAGNSMVTCFTLIRTYEDPTDPYAEWTPIGTVPCNASRSYRITDNQVSPGTVSYRVVASLNGGGYEYSDIETVRIVQH